MLSTLLKGEGRRQKQLPMGFHASESQGLLVSYKVCSCSSRRLYRQGKSKPHTEGLNSILMMHSQTSNPLSRQSTSSPKKKKKRKKDSQSYLPFKLHYSHEVTLKLSRLIHTLTFEPNWIQDMVTLTILCTRL